MLYILHLEPLAERYTEQWYRWFGRDLRLAGIPFRFIEGDQLTTTVESGVVLDVEGTNYWKFSQLMRVCELFKNGEVKDDDVFFTMDLWHPGLESIPYMATLEGIEVSLYGFLHAGSYTNEDFASPMAPWAQFHEVGWAAQCDGVFVGSHYHAQRFHALRLNGTSAKVNIYETGNPFDTREIMEMGSPRSPVEQRERIIIYPHRFDHEKRPGVFMDMMETLWEERQDFTVWFTTSRETFRSNRPELLEQLNRASFDYEIKAGLTKREYYQAMAQARLFVSTTIEENFGYCLAEAIALGCAVAVPDNYSHPELLDHDRIFLFDTPETALWLINKQLDEPVCPALSCVGKYDSSIGEMLGIMTRGDSDGT